MAMQPPPSMAATREKPAPDAKESTPPAPREARIVDPRMAAPPARERRPALMFSGGDISIDGRFEGGEDLEVNCRFRGELVVSGTVVITETGDFEGEIQARRAVVYGTFDGILRASDTVHVRSTGRVTGHVRTDELMVERGGVCSGTVDKADGPISTRSR
jgi:cytoskeletal protein CcmA (bactofilin family)